MRKLITLILGCILSAYLIGKWGIIGSFLGNNISHILLIYIVALGLIHLGGICLKILAVLFVIVEPISDRYCQWYEETAFHKWLHRNDKHKY